MRVYGTTPSGEDIHVITLKNQSGWICRVLTLGGIINELHVPDREGKLDDVVLCFDNAEDMTQPEGWPYFGCIVGRVAGRISGGRFTLDGEEVQLEKNDGNNHLHGGRVGLDKRIWKAIPKESEAGASVELTYVSPDGEEGYPGEVEFSVTYTLSHQGELILDYQGLPSQRTPLSLTNHAYFNLGTGDSIADHRLQILTTRKIPANAEWGLSDEIDDVKGCHEDLSEGKRLGDLLDHPHPDHCGNFYFGQKENEPRLVATLEEPESGRRLEVISTEGSLQLYCGCYLGGQGKGKGRDGGYPSHSGVCLEAQGYPNAVNAPEFEDIIFSPERPYFQKTIFKFGLID